MTRPTLPLDALRALDAIDRKGSFASAAAELFKVPSAITYSIHRLEEDLDVTLFDRTGPRPELTRVGRMVLEEGRSLLAGAERLAENARQLERGWETRLCVALDSAIPLSALHPVLKQLEGLNAGVSVEIRGESLSGCWDALVDGRSDLAVGAVADVCPPGRFATTRLGHLSHWFVAAPGHALCRVSGPVSRESLERHRLVVVADSARNLPHRSLGLTSAERRLVVSTMQQKYEAILAGMGIGHLPAFWAREAVAQGSLCVVDTLEKPPTVESLIAWQRGRSGRALRWFVDAAKRVLTDSSGVFAV